MMKKILFALIVLSFLKCAIPYDGETRLVLETSVIDSDGNPIINQMVTVNVSDQQDYLTDNISKGLTDNNGKLVLIFPSPIGEKFKFDVTFSKPNDIYLEKMITNIYKSDFKNFKLVLNPIKLIKSDQIINFKILGNKVSANNFVKNISINAIQPDAIVYYNPLKKNENYNYLNQVYSILKNQNFILKYTIVDPAINQTGIDYTQNIVAANNNLDFTITY